MPVSSFCTQTQFCSMGSDALCVIFMAVEHHAQRQQDFTFFTYNDTRDEVSLQWDVNSQVI